MLIPVRSSTDADACRQITGPIKRQAKQDLFLDQLMQEGKPQWTENWESIERKAVELFDKDGQHSAYVTLIKKFPFQDCLQDEMEDEEATESENDDEFEMHIKVEEELVYDAKVDRPRRVSRDLTHFTRRPRRRSQKSRQKLSSLEITSSKLTNVEKLDTRPNQGKKSKDKPEFYWGQVHPKTGLPHGRGFKLFDYVENYYENQVAFRSFYIGYFKNGLFYGCG